MQSLMRSWTGPPLLLASQSAIRRSLLENAGIPVEVKPALLDERRLEAEAGPLPAAEVAERLAQAKARAVSLEAPGRIVVGADQTLALEAQRFSKPADRAAAREQLLALRGKTHRLHAAVAVVVDGTTDFRCVETAALSMRPFSETFLERYLEDRLVMTSVGGYRLEGPGIQLFERVEGDYFTILGLPLLPLLTHLRTKGYLLS